MIIYKYPKIYDVDLIKDLRILKAISKKYNFIINKNFKYIINTNDLDFKILEYKNKKYKMFYFAGCFNPYLCKINNVKDF